MTDRPAEERPKDWMEIWFETGEITWQKPLSPEADARIQQLWEELRREHEEGGGT
ncbi:hypothetical protein [Streptomyces sp. SID10815]|uniref:hypothetical protein n=1 Tax=Streptomyces sp. SID10815 TaxID=2706027 RepID=UPI0013CCDB31|nr:hypothetical protein [Streptomyces sp. SID10815]NEA48455.1 hypothetical protein [Streptomyces sp. SID10815]